MFGIGNKGQAGGAENGIIAMIVITAFILIGAVVLDNIATSIDTSTLESGLSTAANNTVTNAGSGLNLASVAPIVFAAVIVLGILMILARRT